MKVEAEYGCVEDKDFGIVDLVRINHIKKGETAPRYTNKDLVHPSKHSDPRTAELMKGKMTRKTYIDEPA